MDLQQSWTLTVWLVESSKHARGKWGQGWQEEEKITCGSEKSKAGLFILSYVINPILPSLPCWKRHHLFFWSCSCPVSRSWHREVEQSIFFFPYCFIPMPGTVTSFLHCYVSNLLINAEKGQEQSWQVSSRLSRLVQNTLSTSLLSLWPIRFSSSLFHLAQPPKWWAQRKWGVLLPSYYGGPLLANSERLWAICHGPPCQCMAMDLDMHPTVPTQHQSRILVHFVQGTPVT